MDWLWWVGAAFALGIVEIIVLDVVVLMLIGGALAGALAAALGAPVWLQVVVACVTSALLVVTLRPWVLRQLKRRVPLTETNAAAQVGRRAIVVAEVSETGGRVKLTGEVWTARLEDDGRPGSPVLAVGSEVEVVRIDGATAVVAPVGATSTA
ncbi:NfeD family protein [Xylanimonas ulmi]|uniref:Membrane protein implicated in regulation of membrane protease activity n=1 Tax=Xylanimonas ulmi TaxID=228973 RepID=A0A4Q7M069_9MICO|nr:NfeD family protein [Xylanibacterium ulmi]RZS61135.1 membrane protein implicated in regulation of membrane protease activity [Xylanibacterium ulmi]